jgi:hypothetical protein
MMENDDQEHQGVPWVDNGIRQGKARFFKTANRFLDLYRISEIRQSLEGGKDELVEYIQWKEEELSEEYEVLRIMWPDRKPFSGIGENGLTYIDAPFQLLHLLHKANHPDGQITIICYVFNTNENSPEYATYTLAQTREQAAIEQERMKDAREVNGIRFIIRSSDTEIPPALLLDWMNEVVLKGWQKVENQNS